MDGRRLRELRLEKGMTQEEFASRVHVTQRAVSNWELSKREPPEAAIEEMCKLFDVSADYLLGFSSLRNHVSRLNIVTSRKSGEEFAERLREILDAHGMRAIELAEKTGLYRGTISGYLSGKYLPKQKNIDLIAKVLNVDTRYLLVGEEEKTKPTAVKIPILGNIAAGVPISDINDIEGYEEITEAMARCGDFFALRVKDESMMPWICSGDTVICKITSYVNSGSIAIVGVNDEEATCKKVIKSKNGITLCGLNAMSYEPHFYSNKEIREKEVVIFGEVFQIRRDVVDWYRK